MILVNMKIGPLPIVVNLCEPSGWQFITSQSFDASYGAGKIAIGVGGGSFTVQVTQGKHKRAQQYRLWYGGLEASGGIGVPGLPNVSFSTESMACGSYGQIYRMPGSPSSAGEGGAPTGFLGTIGIITAAVTSPQDLIGGYTRALMLLGGVDVPLTNSSVTFFKYATVVWGTFAGTPGAGITGLKGKVVGIEPLKS